MKTFLKHIGKFGAVLMLSALTALSVNAATDANQKIGMDVIGTAGTGATYDLAPSKIFSFDSDFGQDIYETIYERVKHEGSDVAITKTLGKRKLSKAELFLLIPGSNIGNLLTQPDPKAKTSPQDVEKRRQEVLRDLVEEKELADIEALAKMEVEPTELFSNGDEGDSGFDLIADLDLIETILFGKQETVLGNNGAGAPAGSNRIGGAGGGNSANSGQNPATSAPNPSAGAAGNRNVDSGAGGQGGASTAADEAQSAILCPVDDAFNNAALAARANSNNNAEEANDNDSGSGAASGGSSGTGSNAGAASDANETGVSTPQNPVTPEPSADWSRPRACAGVFCLKIDAIYKKESSYLANENCIACHFEKINDNFKKTLDHNLVPSKATGNLLELPKCKSSLFAFKLNFLFIPQPILTPPNDDIITKGDFIKNAIKFYEKYYNNPGRCDDAVGGSCKPDPNPTTQAAKNLLDGATSTSDQTQFLIQIRRQAEGKKQEAAQLLNQTRLETEAKSQSGQYQVILQEIETMNGYFEAFAKLYRNISDPANLDNPCESLLNKPQCS